MVSTETTRALFSWRSKGSRFSKWTLCDRYVYNYSCLMRSGAEGLSAPEGLSATLVIWILKHISSYLAADTTMRADMHNSHVCISLPGRVFFHNLNFLINWRGLKMLDGCGDIKLNVLLLLSPWGCKLWSSREKHRGPKNKYLQNVITAAMMEYSL